MERLFATLSWSINQEVQLTKVRQGFSRACSAGCQPGLDVNTNPHPYTSVPNTDKSMSEDKDMDGSEWSSTDEDMDVEEDMADDAPTEGHLI